jgi:hypothetical protein
LPGLIKAMFDGSVNLVTSFKDEQAQFLVFGILVLLVIVLVFFRKESVKVRLGVFFIVFTAVCFGAIAVYYPPTPRVAESKQQLPPANTPSDPCTGVEFAAVSGSIADANWCGTAGATRTLGAQAFFDPRNGVSPDRSCSSYAIKMGNIHQRDLLKQAIAMAKQGDENGAIARIDACQCHNRIAQSSLDNQKRRVYCWLRVQ